VRVDHFLQLRILFFSTDSGFTLSSFLVCRGVTVHVVIFFSFRTLFFLCFVHTDCVLNWCAEPCLFEIIVLSFLRILE
jgi:hypothetical protein